MIHNDQTGPRVISWANSFSGNILGILTSFKFRREIHVSHVFVHLMQVVRCKCRNVELEFYVELLSSHCLYLTDDFVCF